MFLLGVRCGLNVVGSNVIDVGYASVVGADHFGAGQPVYGHFPPDIARGDTYGPVLYYAYVPFEALLAVERELGRPARRPRRRRDVRPAHRRGLWLLGRRLRGPDLGALLAYAWVDVPVHAARGQLGRQRRPRRACS